MKTKLIETPTKLTTAKIVMPSSKSYTNRALLISALIDNKVRIINPLRSDDTQAMISCLKKIGIEITENESNFVVHRGIKTINNQTYKLDANLSGTTIRFLSALAAIIPGTKILYGREGLNKRPIGDLVDGLKQLGAEIEYLENNGFPPVKITPTMCPPSSIKIKGDASSQYLSAILMIAPLLKGLKIEVTGNQVSRPYVDMTLNIMKKFGVSVTNKDYKKYFISKNQKYKAVDYLVEGDVSSAAYFLAIAALTKSTITLKNLNPKSIQGDMVFIEILKSMGNKIIFGKKTIKIIGNRVKTINVNMEDCPDQVQTMAVLAAFTPGVTHISGTKSLRIKETDRVKALQQELKKMNVKMTYKSNSISVFGGKVKPAKINTHGDHRMAMAFSVAGARLPGMEILNPDVVNKTFPNYWKILNQIGIKTKDRHPNIVLIGMRNSGKTTIAKVLSQKLTQPYIDTDEMIINSLKMDISRIVDQYGWDYFRKLESDTIKKVSQFDNKVISTGGGVVENCENIINLKENGIVFYLKVSTKTLMAKNVNKDINRPKLLENKLLSEEIEIIQKKRRKLYEGAADYIIDADSVNIATVVKNILSILR